MIWEFTQKETNRVYYYAENRVKPNNDEVE